MVPDSATAILETVTASIEDAVGLGDIRVLAGGNLKDLGLSRLRLLTVMIELEDEFAIEFPSDAIDRFRIVGDIAFYIQSHEMTPYAAAPSSWQPPATQLSRARPPATACTGFGLALGLAGLAVWSRNIVAAGRHCHSNRGWHPEWGWVRLVG
jgi:acyl carrier protein